MQSTRSQGGCRGQDARNQVLRDSVKGKEDRDCCGLNGGCKGDVLKDGLQARGTGRIGPTFSVRAIGGHLDRDHSRLHSCGVEGMSQNLCFHAALNPRRFHTESHLHGSSWKLLRPSACVHDYNKVAYQILTSPAKSRLFS